jgi:cell volume regulation protein A
MDSVAAVLEIVAFILLLGAFGEFVSSRTGIPDVLWMVCAGILAGPVFHLVSPAALQPAVPLFGAIALTIILSGGASRLRLEEVIAAGPRGLVLGVAGFVCSVVVVCLWLWLATAMGWVKPAPLLAWLIAGTIVGGTSSLIIMPTTAGGRVNPQVARVLEVESSATDALSIVLTMVLIDLLVTGGFSLSRPLLALSRELGIGVGLGTVGALVMLPFLPALMQSAHAYTTFLAGMLIVYGVASQLDGNGAMAVLTAALLVGNASSLVPRLVPGADAQAFVTRESARAMQSQMSFFIKSFFFVLIGLMFPTSPRSILLGAIPVLLLVAARVPAVRLSTMGLHLSRRQRSLLTVAVPRGLAAGVLSAIPVHYGIAGADFSSAIFSLIVTSIVVFSVGVALVERMPEVVAMEHPAAGAHRET